jgi:hypothetical protein
MLNQTDTQSLVKTSDFAPIFSDAIEETEFEGVAKLLTYENYEFEYGGKTFQRWNIKFMDDDGSTPVIRLIDAKYLTRV